MQSPENSSSKQFTDKAPVSIERAAERGRWRSGLYKLGRIATGRSVELSSGLLSPRELEMDPVEVETLPEGLQDMVTGPRLDTPQFIDRKEFFRRVEEIGIASEADYSMQDIGVVRVPVNNFITAIDFLDWSQGRGRKSPKFKDGRKMSSKGAIKAYSKMPSATSMVKDVFAYTQPNGLTLYTPVNDGSHRVAAAMRRGDSTIAVISAIHSYTLEDDIVTLPSQS